MQDAQLRRHQVLATRAQKSHIVFDFMFVLVGRFVPGRAVGLVNLSCFHVVPL